MLSFDLVNNVLVIQVASTASESACPVCQSHTSRMHSHYSRKAADLACGGHQVHLILHVRKFFCTNRECPRKIFVERLTAASSARGRGRTGRVSRVRFQSRKRAAASSATNGRRRGRRPGVSFNPASGRRPLQPGLQWQDIDFKHKVSIPQAGGGLFSRKGVATGMTYSPGFNPSSGRRPLQPVVTCCAQALVAMFQSLKRAAASSAALRFSARRSDARVSIPQAGGGLFSRRKT